MTKDMTKKLWIDNQTLRDSLVDAFIIEHNERQENDNREKEMIMPELNELEYFEPMANRREDKTPKSEVIIIEL